MTIMTLATGGAVPADATPSYRPGVCNIGAAEISRRRRAGHVGLAATIGLLALLVAADAPPLTRLALAIPATISASGYLQARLKFCAGFGQLGIMNFGELGDSIAVANDEARAADRRRAREIGLASMAIGAAVGVLAVLLPF
jgi:hypothetical protein